MSKVSLSASFVCLFLVSASFFLFFSFTFLFFIEHFTYRRNNNFRDILRGLQLGQTARRFGGTVDLAHQFHHLFWFGDLNYRVDLNIEVNSTISKDASLSIAMEEFSTIHKLLMLVIENIQTHSSKKLWPTTRA